MKNIRVFLLMAAAGFLYLGCIQSEEPCNPEMPGSKCWVVPACDNFIVGPGGPCRDCDTLNPAHQACIRCNNRIAGAAACRDCNPADPAHLACQAPVCDNFTAGAAPCADCDSSNPLHAACSPACSNQSAQAPPCADCDSTNPLHLACWSCSNTAAGSTPCADCDSSNTAHLSCYISTCSNTATGAAPCADCDSTNPLHSACYSCDNSDAGGPACADCDSLNSSHLACSICDNLTLGSVPCRDCSQDSAAHLACYLPPPDSFIFFDPGLDTSTYPKTLSRAGLYINGTITPEAFPYRVNLPHWKDGFNTLNYLLLKPGTQISYGPTADTSDLLEYPDGAAFVQTVYVDTISGDSSSRMLVETRMLMKKYGLNEWVSLNYRWLEDQSEARWIEDMFFHDTLLTYRVDQVERQSQWKSYGGWWCTKCHYGRNVLGFFTAQLNGPAVDNSGINQIQHFFDRGIFSGTPPADYNALPKWVSPDNTAVSAEERARMYLAANCSSCHGTRGKVEGQDLNMDYHAMRTLEPELTCMQTTAQIPDCYDVAIVFPADPGASTLYRRMSVRQRSRSMFMPASAQMPPTNTFIPDTAGLRLIGEWIAGIPADTAFLPAGCDTIPIPLSSHEKCPDITPIFPK